MSSTPDQNKARRIRLEIKEKGLGKVHPAKVSWIKEYEAKTVPRRPPSITVSNELPKPDESSKGSSGATATSPSPPAPNATGATATPAAPGAPPPLNASQPGATSASPGSASATGAGSKPGAPSATPSAGTVALNLKFDANYKPGPIGEQLGGLWLGYITNMNNSIERRGGTPYPSELAQLGALSTSFLADKYLAGYFGDDAVLALNAAVPVAWVLWQEHKLDKRDADPIETSATNVPVEATKPKATEPPKPQPKPSAAPGTASHMQQPLNGTHANPTPSKEEREVVNAVMGGS